jgi:hypothetical protein
MRRRLLRLALLSIVVPLVLEVMETVANQLEANKGPTTTSRSLRQASVMGRRVVRR